MLPILAPSMVPVGSTKPFSGGVSRGVVNMGVKEVRPLNKPIALGKQMG